MEIQFEAEEFDEDLDSDEKGPSKNHHDLHRFRNLYKKSLGLLSAKNAFNSYKKQ
jgi:hypothetical protein